MTGQKKPTKSNSYRRSTVPKPAFASLLMGQVFAVGSASLMLAFVSHEWALALAAGAFLHIVPQTYLTVLAFRYRGAAQMQRAYISTNQGLVGKWLLFATGLALIFKFWPEAHLLSLLTGYVLAQISSWIVYPILINRPLGGK